MKIGILHSYLPSLVWKSNLWEWHRAPYQSLIGIYTYMKDATHKHTVPNYTQSALVFMLYLHLWDQAGTKFMLENTHRVICKSKLVLCRVTVRTGCNSWKNNRNKLVEPVQHIQHYQMDTPTFSSASENILPSLNHVSSRLDTSPQLLRPVQMNKLWILALHQCLILAPCSDSYFLHHKKLDVSVLLKVNLFCLFNSDHHRFTCAFGT